jgi:Transglycosylase-like domain
MPPKGRPDRGGAPNKESPIRRQPLATWSRLSGTLVVVGALTAGTVINQAWEPARSAALPTPLTTQRAVLQASHQREASLAVSRDLGAEARSIGVSVARLRSMWRHVAACEVGGRWSMVGPAYSGIGFANSTWLTFGGSRFAPVAGRATPDQQIDIAMRVTGGWVPDQYGCSRW